MSELVYKKINNNNKKFEEVKFNESNLSDNSVLIKLINLHFIQNENNKVSFGEIKTVGKVLDKSIVGKKVFYVTNEISEYSILDISKVYQVNESTNISASSFKNKLTIEHIFNNIVKDKNIIIDSNQTFENSINDIIENATAKQLKVFFISEKGNDKTININPSSSEFETKIKEISKDSKPFVYISFNGGSLQSKVLQNLPFKSEILLLGDSNENLSGFSSAVFIFHQKKITGVSFDKIAESLNFEKIEDTKFEFKEEHANYKFDEIEKIIEENQVKKFNIHV